MSTDAAISSVLAAQQGAVETQIQTAVARKALEATRSGGEAVNQLLEDAAQLSKALGKGAHLDTSA